MFYKKIFGFLTLIFITQINFAYASDSIDEIGFAHIKKIQEKIIEENKNNVGNLTISDNINISKIVNKKNIPSTEAEKILIKLNEIVDNQNKNNLKEALSGIELLSSDYPESVLFKKWKAIYLNRLQQYQDSLNSFIEIKRTFPFDEQVQNGIEYDIYMIDNYRNLGDNDNAKKILEIAKNKLNLIDLINEKENENNVTSFDLLLKNTKNINTVLMYQDFMLQNDDNNDVDEIYLNKIWDSIPKEKIYSLNVFYGFDLDEIGLIYGKIYNRKDILKKYVEHKENSTDQKTIEKIKMAKQIIYKKI